MALSFNWKSVAMSAALLAGACGDDGGGDKPTTPTNDGGTQQTMDGGSVTPGNQLGPQIAGKACTSAAECGTGSARCADRLTLGSAGTLIEGVLQQEIFLANPGGYCTSNCTANAACGEGGVCFGAFGTLSAGECRKTCNADTDCREGYECAKPGSFGGADGGAPMTLPLPPTCQPRLKPTPIGANVVGKPCTEQNAATVCGGAQCVGNVCGGVCAGDGDCGAGARCEPVRIYGTLGICVETCAADADCNGYTGESGGIGCVNNVCSPKLFPLMPGVVGNACADRTQCGGSAECATSLGLPPVAAPGGYCTLQGCNAASQCGGGACIGGITGSRCYKTCTADGDCRGGYTCQERMAYGNMPARVCAPAPSSGDAGVPGDAG